MARRSAGTGARTPTASPPGARPAGLCRSGPAPARPPWRLSAARATTDTGSVGLTWPRPRAGAPSAELLGQGDDDALGAADVAEQVFVLVLHHVADEFSAVGAQAGKHVLDVVDGEHDAPYAQCVHGCVRLSGGRRRRVKLDQLKPAMTVRHPQHCDVVSDAVEPDAAVYPLSLDCHLALQLETEFDKERGSSLEVVDNDADVVHPQKRHVPSVGVGSSPSRT